jgi:hypothetical protein
MDKYADEMRYRPRPVVALVGMPQVQAALVSQLSREARSCFAGARSPVAARQLSTDKLPPPASAEALASSAAAALFPTVQSESTKVANPQSAHECSAEPTASDAHPRPRFQVTRLSYGGHTPRRKEKRTTYEGYSPGGILKLSWVLRFVCERVCWCVVYVFAGVRNYVCRH